MTDSQHRLLVVGIGNPLRGDDGVGAAVVEALRGGCAAGVDLLVCHQLTPELAPRIASATRVVFVDASATDPPGAVTSRCVAPSTEAQSVSHSLSPETLVGLARAVYGRTTPAVVVTVGAASFEHRDTLSPRVRAAVPRAAAEVSDALA